jgi:hypothetical protein
VKKQKKNSDSVAENGKTRNRNETLGQQNVKKF